MKLRAVVLPLVCVGLMFGIRPMVGADCLFKASDDGSLKRTLADFHDVMSKLIHGPVAKGDYGPVKQQASEMLRLKEAVMSSSLPKNLAGRCDEISARASEFSSAVDQLAEASKPGGNDAAVKTALDRVHQGYQALNSSLVTLEDLLDDFHTLVRPLWHSAYPKKDVAAIKAAAPKLRIRSRLILATAEQMAPEKVEKAKKLQDATGMLSDAIDADDDSSILEALRVVHDSYEQLASGAHSEGSFSEGS